MRRVSDHAVSRMQVTLPAETASMVRIKDVIRGIPATEFIRKAVNEKPARSRIVDAGIEFANEYSDVLTRMAREE